MRASDNLKAHRSLRLALDDRGPFLDLSGGVDVGDLQLDQITAARQARMAGKLAMVIVLLPSATIRDSTNPALLV